MAVGSIGVGVSAWGGGELSAAVSTAVTITSGVDVKVGTGVMVERAGSTVACGPQAVNSKIAMVKVCFKRIKGPLCIMKTMAVIV